MIGLFRRRVAAVRRGVTYCEGGAQVCTAECGADARLDRARITAASQLLGWR